MKSNWLLARLFFLALAVVVCSQSVLSAQGLKINVSAGAVDRRETVVQFHPGKPGPAIRFLAEEHGERLPVQVDSEGIVSFILPYLAKGSSMTFTAIRESRFDPAPIMQTKRDGTRIQFLRKGLALLEYQAEEGPLPRADITPIYKRGGYIHPLLSPSGAVVTDDFPANHVHHHGVWWAWTKTEFDGRQPDFWNMGQGKGKVEFVRLMGDSSGPVFAALRAAHRYVDLSATPPKAALEEVWELRAWNIADADKPRNVLDLASTQNCSGSLPLKLPKYHYGGLGLRGNGAWDGKDNAVFLTSEGETDRVKGNETRGRWCYMGGLVNGRQTGVAILCHPGNFRAPQPMRLHPTEPFFCYAPSQSGDWEISPGKAYVSRYRLVAFDGAPDRAEIDRLWNDYANPVAVVVEFPQ